MLWNSVLAAMGWWLAKFVPLNDLFPKVQEYNSYLTYAGLGIAAICVVFIACRLIFYKKKGSTL
jgi:hypothetical protein